MPVPRVRLPTALIDAARRPIRIPRLTTRQLMGLVALMALVMAAEPYARRAHYYRGRWLMHAGFEKHLRAKLAEPPRRWYERQGTAFVFAGWRYDLPDQQREQYERLAPYAGELRRKYWRAMWRPWLPVPPDPPPPQ